MSCHKAQGTEGPLQSAPLATPELGNNTHHWQFLGPAVGLPDFEQRWPVVGAETQKGINLLVQVRAQWLREAVDNGAEPFAGVVFGRGRGRVGKKVFQTAAEDVVLLDIGIEQAGLANDLVEAGKNALLLGLVVVHQPLRPQPGQDEQVFNVFGLLDVGRLQVNAVDAAQNGIVTKGHVVGNGNGFVGFLFKLVMNLMEEYIRYHGFRRASS
jgi:hypothetical protein